MTDRLFTRRPTVAVIGAGIAGLSAARALAEAGARVQVYEKSRGLGGRLATRRPFGREDALGVDHGAPYAEGPSGRADAGWDAVAALGTVWDAAPEGAVVGAPGMSQLARALAEDLRIETGVRIVQVAEGEDWLLIDADGGRRGPFDAVISAVPAPQAAELLGEACPEAAAAEMAPTWTLLLAFEASIGAGGPAVFAPERGPLRLIVRNSDKPGRDPRESWVGHAAPDWSAERLEEEPDAIAEALLAAFGAALGVAPPPPLYRAAHRWRYATVVKPVGQAFRLREDGRFGACGDWRLGPTAGDAWRSGSMLGRAMAAKLIG